MAKDTPFFKFDAESWLGGSIQFTPLECKGLFIDLCALYWESQKPIKIDIKFKLRTRCDEGTLTDLIGTLTDLEIINNSEAGITIPFLDKLMEQRKEWLEKCSNAGKKSAAVKGTSSNKKEERRKKRVERRKKTEKEEINKRQVAPFVFLTDDELKKVKDKYGDDQAVNSAIDKLNNYKGSNGKKYKSDYHVLIGWVYDDWKKNQDPNKPAYGMREDVAADMPGNADLWSKVNGTN